MTETSPRRTRVTPNQIEIKCDSCGESLYYYPSQFKMGERHFCNRLCLGKWRSEQQDTKAAHWKGGEKTQSERAYWFLPWHPRADKKGYVPRAVIVAQLVLGRMIEPQEVVHHQDEDTLNDDPTNLIVYPSQAEHMRDHGLKLPVGHMEKMHAAAREWRERNAKS